MKLVTCAVLSVLALGCNADGPDRGTKARLAELAAQVQALQSRLDEQASEVSRCYATTDRLQTELRAQAEKVARRDVLDALVAFVSVEGTDIVVEGANLHVRNALGRTDSQDGTGNLIVGHNEAPSGRTLDRSGSHNLVLGQYNEFSSYSGYVGGRDNSISAPFAAVVSGSRNAATDYGAVVASGAGNVAAGAASVVITGQNNTTVGDLSAIAAGDQNTVQGSASAIVGGYGNTTQDDLTAVVGDDGAVPRNENAGDDERASTPGG